MSVPSISGVKFEFSQITNNDGFIKSVQHYSKQLPPGECLYFSEESLESFERKERIVLYAALPPGVHYQGIDSRILLISAPMEILEAHLPYSLTHGVNSMLYEEISEEERWSTAPSSLREVGELCREFKAENGSDARLRQIANRALIALADMQQISEKQSPVFTWLILQLLERGQDLLAETLFTHLQPKLMVPAQARVLELALLSKGTSVADKWKNEEPTTLRKVLDAIPKNFFLKERVAELFAHYCRRLKETGDTLNMIEPKVRMVLQRCAEQRTMPPQTILAHALPFLNFSKGLSYDWEQTLIKILAHCEESVDEKAFPSLFRWIKQNPAFIKELGEFYTPLLKHLLEPTYASDRLRFLEWLEEVPILWNDPLYVELISITLKEPNPSILSSLRALKPQSPPVQARLRACWLEILTRMQPLSLTELRCFLESSPEAKIEGQALLRSTLLTLEAAENREKEASPLRPFVEKNSSYWETSIVARLARGEVLEAANQTLDYELPLSSALLAALVAVGTKASVKCALNLLERRPEFPYSSDIPRLIEKARDLQLAFSPLFARFKLSLPWNLRFSQLKPHEHASFVREAPMLTAGELGNQKASYIEMLHTLSTLETDEEPLWALNDRYEALGVLTEQEEAVRQLFFLYIALLTDAAIILGPRSLAQVEACAKRLYATLTPGQIERLVAHVPTRQHAPLHTALCDLSTATRLLACGDNLQKLSKIDFSKYRDAERQNQLKKVCMALANETEVRLKTSRDALFHTLDAIFNLGQPPCKFIEHPLLHAFFFVTELLLSLNERQFLTFKDLQWARDLQWMLSTCEFCFIGSPDLPIKPVLSGFAFTLTRANSLNLFRNNPQKGLQIALRLYLLQKRYNLEKGEAMQDPFQLDIRKICTEDQRVSLIEEAVLELYYVSRYNPVGNTSYFSVASNVLSFALGFSDIATLIPVVATPKIFSYGPAGQETTIPCTQKDIRAFWQKTLRDWVAKLDQLKEREACSEAFCSILERLRAFLDSPKG